MKLLMRSLAVRLSLAFLFVGLLGAVLVASFVGWRARQDFDRFVYDRGQSSLVDVLTRYYEINGTWAGVEVVFAHGPYPTWRPGPGPGGLVLIDADGTVMSAGKGFQVGDQLTVGQSTPGVPIKSEGRTVGWLLFDGPGGPPSPGSPEAEFLGRLSRGITFGALGATIIALLLGVLLARTISKPVRALTEATRRVAQGELGHQVRVDAQDELGELAGSFNQMSADLARANQLRRQMTADIAHDLRTPLSVILGYTEALSEGKLQGGAEAYQVMHQEARHLQRLIDDLRTLSLADSGELTLARQQLAPAELLGRIAAAHRAQAEDKGISLQVLAPPDLPRISVDPDRMAQVFDNLITNALRYTSEGGTIQLSAEHRLEPETTGRAQVHLRLKDTGAGIPQEDLPYIFNRFYRGDRSRHGGGESGLGLAIARSLVELHGGRISVESVRGRGTTFTIALPAVED